MNEMVESLVAQPALQFPVVCAGTDTEPAQLEAGLAQGNLVRCRLPAPPGNPFGAIGGCQGYAAGSCSPFDELTPAYQTIPHCIFSSIEDLPGSTGFVRDVGADFLLGRTAALFQNAVEKAL
jgi:hypothetical protein